MNTKNQHINDFLKELHRAQSNPIYFLEEYWNKLHDDAKIELTDEEKQQIFDAHKSRVPLFEDNEAFHRYMERLKDAKKKGLKDWEIFL